MCPLPAALERDENSEVDVARTSKLDRVLMSELDARARDPSLCQNPFCKRLNDKSSPYFYHVNT